MELRDDLDQADEVRVEVGQVLGRNPVLTVLPRASGCLHRVTAQEVSPNLEPGHVAHEAGGRVLCVPVAGDLDRVVLVDDRVEDRLARETRREGADAARPDELEFLLADRAVERHGLDRAHGNLLAG